MTKEEMTKIIKNYIKYKRKINEMGGAEFWIGGKIQFLSEFLIDIAEKFDKKIYFIDRNDSEFPCEGEINIEGILLFALFTQEEQEEYRGAIGNENNK